MFNVNSPKQFDVVINHSLFGQYNEHHCTQLITLRGVLIYQLTPLCGAHEVELIDNVIVS